MKTKITYAEIEAMIMSQKDFTIYKLEYGRLVPMYKIENGELYENRNRFNACGEIAWTKNSAFTECKEGGMNAEELAHEFMLGCKSTDKTLVYD